MDVNVITSTDFLPITEDSVKALVLDFVDFAEIDHDEIAIHFVDTQKICALHAQFFDDPSPTDCITFPMDTSEETGYTAMGDIFVCPETAQKYVEKNGGDRYEELTLYVVHGLLHLLGYDDLEEEAENEMRKAEAAYLARVKDKGLWIN